MIHRTLSLLVFFSLAAAASAQQASEDTWRFAVSGDSRNCGDVVMPTIAESVLQHQVEFYWHLGDFRVGYDIDEDMRNQYGDKLTVDDYTHDAWGDFLSNQIAPFGKLPIYLGIGNHELYRDGKGKEDESHADFITQFHYWLDKPELRKQRLSDDPKNGSLNAYYHWKKRPVDFIYLDNSKDEGFDKDQLAWLEGVLKKDKTEQDVLAVVVGMHRALPNSFACGHSMNGDPGTSPDANRSSLESGRAAYKYLLDFQSAAHKRVYVLASHSHFFMQDIFDTPYWKNSSEKDRGVLDGWLIGTAGAKRYRLPDNLPSATLAITYTYGYLLARVHGDGTVNFEFQQITEDDVPPDVKTRYGKKFVDVCFLANRDDTPHVPEASCNDK
ncbi:MAG TPA: hypothetical protein VN875_09115 [Candidatus Binatus sp.]|nr:hypothetical protein [Candidatus Binatus sp.]